MTKDSARLLGARCDLCPCKHAPLIPPRPAKGRVRLVVVADNPSRSDENRKAALSGAAGKLLEVELGKRGVGLGECHITYASLCRGEGDKDNEKAAECCAPRLLAEVAGVLGAGSAGGVSCALGPKEPNGSPLLLLGRSPLRSVLGVRKHGVARGFIWRVPEKAVKEIKPARKGKKARELTQAEELKRATVLARNRLAGMVALPTLALSFVLKADTWAPVFRVDLDRVGRLANGEGVEAFAEEGGPPNLVGGLSVLGALGAEVSCDIETDGIDPRTCNILCVGFADLLTGHVCVIWPFREDDAPGLGRWLGGRKRVVFHHGHGFDLLVMRAKGITW